MTADTYGDVARNYAEDGIGERILAALAEEGVDVDNLTTSALSAIDQFHTRGIAATREQAEAALIEAGMEVLDVGCGVGGPARYLAETFGCRVTGIDLTAEFVEVAAMLSARTGLSGQTEFRRANALDLPFGEACFDLAWSQNVSMNVPDKAALFASVFRVLKPGARFVSADIAGGDGRALDFPLPWARDPAISFVGAQDEMKAALEAAGFRIADWRDTTADAVAVQQDPAQKARRGKLGVGLVAGADFAERSGNLARCLADGRLSSVLFVAEKA